MASKRLTKFEQVTTRLMTHAEVKEQAQRLKLSNPATAFIVSTFDMVADADNIDGLSEDDVSDSLGRCRLYTDYDNVESDLGAVMGMPDLPTQKQTAFVQRVMRTFFFE